MFQPLGFTGYSIVQILLSFYGNALFFALYAAWIAVAFVELGQRQELSAGKKLGWGALVLAGPFGSQRLDLAHSASCYGSVPCWGRQWITTSTSLRSLPTGWAISARD